MSKIITVKGTFKGNTIEDEDGVKYRLKVFNSHPIRVGFFSLMIFQSHWVIVRELTKVIK